MITTFCDVPVMAFLNMTPSRQPEMVIRRGHPREHWLVLDGDLLTKPEIIQCTSGDLVRVPLMSYITLDTRENLSSFMFELGVRAAALCLDHPDAAIQMHIARGDQVLDAELDGQPAARVFLGAAFRLKE